MRSPRPYASVAEVGNLECGSVNVEDPTIKHQLFEGRVACFLDFWGRVLGRIGDHSTESLRKYIRRHSGTVAVVHTITYIENGSIILGVAQDIKSS